MRQGDLNQSLIKAVYNRDVKQVKGVLDLGADVNATDDFGITALGQIYAYRGWHWYYSYTSGYSGSAEIIMLLLKRGAKVPKDHQDEPLVKFR